MVHQVLLCVMLLSTPGTPPAEEMPVKSPPHGEPAAPHGQIVSLLTGGLNALEPFTPKLSISRGGRGRHVPMLAATAPWAANQNVPVEVPEYVHGHTAERRRGAFLFAGRPLEVAAKIGGVRYASKTPPAWRKTADGRFVLDNELAGGLTIRFRVIPHDRMLEVRVGLTNAGTLPVKNVWAQLCYKGTGSPVLAERHPGSSFMLIEGKLKSWDAAGQDLAWLDAYREPRAKDRFRMSCFFMAYTGKGPIEGKLGKVRGGSPVFSLGKRIDVPAIAKLDEAKRRGVIIYSPSAGKAFYNVLQPCFHADPSIGTVKPNTTGWSQTYMLYVAGDVEGMMKKLAAAHKLITARPQTRRGTD